MRLEVVIGGEDTGTNQFFLEDGDEVEQVFGRTVTDIIDLIGRNGESVVANLFLRSMLHDALDAFNDIIDISEVALTVAVIEDLDGLSLTEFVGETKVGHVGTSGRSIDGEEAQSCGGNIVEFGIGMRQQFVALLRGGIEADGVVHLVVGAVGYFLVGAVNAGRRGIDEMFHFNANLRPTPALPV